MKEIYVSPQLELVSFVAAAKIASSDDLLGGSSTVVDHTSIQNTDIDLDL